MDNKTICLHAALEAKLGIGGVTLAGQKLNLVLQDLKLNRNLEINRVSTTYLISAGTFGPFALPLDYLRPYDLSYPLQGPNGMTQFLTKITMEQWDQEFKGSQTANYPYEYATDVSTQAIAATTVTVPSGAVASVAVTNGGAQYLTPPAVQFAGGGGSGAVAVAHLGIITLTANATGSGYSVGDTLTYLGAGATRPCKAVVTTIGGGGAITSLSVIDSGDYTVLPVGNSGFTGGTGTGASFGVSNIVGAVISSVVVTTPGSGYTSAPTVSFTGGGGVGAAATASLSVGTVTPGKGQLYIYPQSNGVINATFRYFRDQPEIVTPETDTNTPWFPYHNFLVKATAELCMGISGDDRLPQYAAQTMEMLRPYLIMEGDEQQTVREIKLDPRRFQTNRGLRPTKVNPY